ncbi:pirin [Burkholderia multivorans]|nr:pirin [Burkholderia multivorans]PRH17099.1 pirin [Burkholderia multivorans]
MNEQDAIASGNVLANLADAPEPTFLDDEGPPLDVPLFITRTNARELFGLRPGETIAQALTRKTSAG